MDKKIILEIIAEDKDVMDGMKDMRPRSKRENLTEAQKKKLLKDFSNVGKDKRPMRRTFSI